MNAITRISRAVLVGALAASATGLVSAAVTRTLMRAVAALTREPTNFSIGGSAGIALIYTIALLPGCIALALSRRWWPWLVFGAGAALLIFEAVAIGVQETATASDMTFQRTLGLGIVLLTMAGTYTLQIRTAARLSRSRTTRRPVAVNARRHDERSSNGFCRAALAGSVPVAAGGSALHSSDR